MSSTRNRNTAGNYILEQSTLKRQSNMILSLPGSNGPAYIPNGGSAIPSHLSRDSLSHNPVDIESMLMGINSTNLVDPSTPIVPDLKKINSIKFYERAGVCIPLPLDDQSTQRTGLYQHN
jgi:hypothetical protein